ncbi:MAG: type II toxin-antitoxin system YafQ family toxin [Synergistaceae bacterium]|nr:type II toxin-antitoxin system YafQ family toxin [Synergistaceae bacterium]
MRTIKQATDFKRSKKKIDRGGRYNKAMKERFEPAVLALANDEPLDYTYHDHELKGDMEGRRECHILFDLVLVYRKIGDDVLYLDDIGTHVRGSG